MTRLRASSGGADDVALTTLRLLEPHINDGTDGCSPAPIMREAGTRQCHRYYGGVQPVAQRHLCTAKPVALLDGDH
jgi:hypothetical protein